MYVEPLHVSWIGIVPHPAMPPPAIGRTYTKQFGEFLAATFSQVREARSGLVYRLRVGNGWYLQYVYILSLTRTACSGVELLKAQAGT